MARYTKNDLDYVVDLGVRICGSFKHCKQGCPFCVNITKENNFVCTLSAVKDFLIREGVITNEEKFKEVFGFPVYELHQLSPDEERKWLEHEYKETDKLDKE